MSLAAKWIRTSGRSSRAILRDLKVGRGAGLGLLGLLGLLSGLGAVLRANVVLDWNAVMMAGIRAETTGPALSTRNLALLHLAIYDAVNSAAPTHQPYLYQEVPAAGTSPEAAAAAAGYEVLLALYPGLRARADDTFQTWLATTVRSAAVSNGLALGKRLAERTLSARAADGAATDVPYIPSAEPGQWRRTPPFFRPPLTPRWRYVQPFAVPDIAAMLPPPPPGLGSPEYAEGFNIVKAIGSKNSTLRTAEQTEIAVFWSDFSYTAMPPGHWNELAASIVRNTATGLADTARLFALLNLAQADSAIVCWEAKFRHNLWRPVTAIQRADEDGNANTDADPAWDSRLAAPPFPAYTSGHSTFSAASASVVADFFGTDAIAFTAASDSLPGVFRSFGSLSACVDEIGLSRIYGGIHFPFDNTAGKATGRKIAAYVLANYLLPNERLPFLRLERINHAGLAVRLHGRIGTRLRLESSGDLVRWEAGVTIPAVPGGHLRLLPGTDAASFMRVIEEQP